MAKQKHKEKQDKNELEIILEQLKKSYGSDSSEDLDKAEEHLTEEKDAELSSMLDKLFSSGAQERTDIGALGHDEENSPTVSKEELDTESDNTSDDPSDAENTVGHTDNHTDVIADESGIPKEIPIENGNCEPKEVIAEENETDEPEEIIVQEQEIDEPEEIIVQEQETENLEATNEEEERTVDNILDIMFSGKSSTDPTVYENEDDVIDDVDVIAADILEADKGTVADELSDITYLDEEDLSGDDEEDLVSDEQIIFPKPEQELPGNFAVEDEEYDVSESPLKNPHLILSPTEYTVDPLQEGLPSLIAETESHVIDESEFEQFTSEACENKNNDFEMNDISLLLKFGYENEVKTKFGEELTQEAILEKENYFIPEAHKKPFGFCGKELSDRDQISEITAKYKSEKRGLIARIAIVSVIALFILSCNIFFEFFSDRISYPIVLAMELMFLLLIGLILYKKLYAGILSILRFEAGLYSILTFVLVTCCSYNIASIVIFATNHSSVNYSELMIFGFDASLFAVLTLIADLVNCIKESNTFDIIASSDCLFTAERQHGKAISSVRGNGAGEDQRADYISTNEHAYKIRKVSLISGYFKKTSQGQSGSVNLIVLLGVVPIISLVIGCTCALGGNSIMRGVSAMMMTIMLCTPFSLVFTHALSEFIMSLRLKNKKTAFIGSDSATEYSKTETLIFRDNDAVEINSCTEIQPGKNANVKRYISTAYEVFKALGGPLSSISKNIKGSDFTIGGNDDHELIINEISDNGIDLYFDSSMNILLGDKLYMKAHGINVKTDTNLSTATKGADRAVIYMAFDGSPKLGFIINSSISPDFLSMVSTLENDGVKVYVETYEPYINDLYFEQNKDHNTTAIAVHKPDEYENLNRKQICNSGVISASNALSLTEAIRYSREIVMQRNHTARINFVLVLFGIFASCLLTVLLSLPNTSSIIVTLKSHITTIFNVFMAGGLIPGAISLFKLNKTNGDKAKNNE